MREDDTVTVASIGASLGILTTDGPRFSFDGNNLGEPLYDGFGTRSPRAVEVGIVANGRAAPLLIPEGLRRRLFEFLTAPREVVQRAYQRGWGSACFLAGESPWAAAFPIASHGMELVPQNARSLDVLRAGVVVAVMRDLEKDFLAVGLGSGYFLVLPPRASDPLVVVRSQALLTAVPGSAVYVAHTEESFEKEFRAPGPMTLAEWKDLTKKPLTWSQYDWLFTSDLYRSIRTHRTASGETIGKHLFRRQTEKHPESVQRLALGIRIQNDGTLVPGVTMRTIDRAFRTGYRIARAFYDREGKPHYVTYGGRIDPSWEEYDLDRVPPRIIGEMFVRRLMPFSLRRTYHDLEHALGLLSYGTEFGALADALASPSCRLPKDDRTIRVVYAWETLALVPATNREAMLRYLHPIFSRGRPSLKSVDEVEAALREWDFERELVPHLKRLLDDYDRFVVGYGGAARDLTINPFISARPSRATANGVAARLRVFLAHHEGTPTHLRDGRRDALILRYGSLRAALTHELARFEVMLWGMSFVTLDEMFEGLASPELPRTSALYRFFVGTGVFESIDGLSADEEVTVMNSIRTHSK